jgi:pimeloyl-ACP methyl ester carboxylesterase
MDSTKAGIGDSAFSCCWYGRRKDRSFCSGRFVVPKLRGGKWARFTIVSTVATLALAPAVSAALSRQAAPKPRPQTTHDRSPRRPAHHHRRAKHSRPSGTGQATSTIAFAVTNVNQTSIACAGNGGHYTVRGELVLPSPTSPASVTLYLHGLGFGDWYWAFDSVNGYDYVTSQAAAGHASVIVSELGYGSSDHPPGTALCVGSQATIAHQIVQDLRSGSYTTSAGTAPSFKRVAIAGHSLGGLIAEVEAGNFHDVNALAVLAYSDLLPSATALSTFGQSTLDCTLSPQSSGGAPGYAPFGQTTADFDSIMFYNADPAVVAAVNAKHELNPCGDITSVPAAIASNQLTLPTIKAPVLFALASNDALFTPPAAKLAATEFRGSSALTQMTFPSTGHAFTFGRSAAVVTGMIGGWLKRYGF